MLALKIALRELRGGLRDFRLFLGCLVVGVTVIASVGILAGSVEDGIARESKSLLGGDIEIGSAGRALSPEQQRFLSEWGKVSATVGMRAMATFGQDSTLVELKGVDANYPLLGSVGLASSQPFAQAMGQGRLIIGEDLRERLGVKTGDKLTLGDTSFTVSAIITHEPDRIAGAFSLGPHVLASMADLEKSGLLMPGGLIKYNYRVLLNDSHKLDTFRAELTRRFPHEAWIVKTVNESNRTVRDLVARLQLFLTLAGLSSLLIGGVGVMSATEAYVGAKSITIATFKALGAERGMVMAIYGVLLSLITLLGIALSALASLLLSALLLPFLAQFLPVSHASIGALKPLLLAGAFGALTVLTFSFAALSRGMEVKPALLFRGSAVAENLRLTGPARLINLLPALALMALVIISADDRKIAGGFMVAALLCFFIFTAAARALSALARRLTLSPGVLRLAVASLHRPGAPVFSIMLSIGLGLSVLIALLLVQDNIERDIRQSIPSEAPSLFLIDIQPSEKDALMHFLTHAPSVSDVKTEPMVRGRIARLKNVPVEQAVVGDEAKWATESDRGISYAAAPPEGTRLVQGAWWPKDYHGRTLASLDRKLADGMGLQLGDTVTLNIMGETIDATIANLREVNYLNLRINFALILSPGDIEHFPATYIATLRTQNEQSESALVRSITKQFPNVSSIRIRESLEELDTIVGHISTAVRITALFTFLSGAMVLGSTLANSLSKRAYDTAMFKVLGARRRDILTLFMTEWLVIAAVTGLLSCLFGAVGAWLILKRLAWVEFHLLLAPMAESLCFMLLFIAVLGLLLHSRAFALKANVVLRNE